MNLADVYGDTFAELTWHLTKMQNTGIIDSHTPSIDQPGSWMVTVAGKVLYMNHTELRHFIFGCMRVTAKYLRPIAALLDEQETPRPGEVPSGAIVRRVWRSDWELASAIEPMRAAVTLFESPTDDDQYWVVAEQFSGGPLPVSSRVVPCGSADIAVRTFNEHIEAFGLPGNTRVPTTTIRKP